MYKIYSFSVTKEHGITYLADQICFPLRIKDVDEMISLLGNYKKTLIEKSDLIQILTEKLNEEFNSSLSVKSNGRNNNKLSKNKKTKVFSIYGKKCLKCQSDKDVCIDHVKPYSKGGTNDISNLQPLCRSCNSAKRSKEIDYRTDNVNI